MATRILSAEFLGSAGPNSPSPNKKNHKEVVVAGRSNVGKSTIINNLLGQSISYVSKTPGSTLLVNYFSVKYETDGIAHTFCLVDTPGFGYAKVDFAKREELSELISSYFKTSPNLRLGLLLNDIRRNPEEDEITLLKILAERGVNSLVIATKADKVGTNDRIKQLKILANGYGLQSGDIFYSSLKPDLSGVLDRLGYLLNI
jgi:GTP-binding protein